MTAEAVWTRSRFDGLIFEVENPKPDTTAPRDLTTAPADKPPLLPLPQWPAPSVRYVAPAGYKIETLRVRSSVDRYIDQQGVDFYVREKMARQIGMEIAKRLPMTRNYDDMTRDVLYEMEIHVILPDKA